jgi:signal transduction histidine kinase
MRHHRRHHGRLAKRIYLHILGVLIIFAVGSGVLFATGFRKEFLHRSMDRLTRHAAHYVADRWDDPTQREQVMQHLADDLGLDLQLRDVSGNVISRVGDELAHPVASVAVMRRNTHELLGTLESAPARRLFHPIIWRPIATVALALLVVGLATVPLARRISRPVERLTEATRRFGGGDLSYRVPLASRGDDELTRLSRAWNDMAERIERLVVGQKELLANVSHELRSPLARIRVALELMPRGADAEARLRDIESDLAELDRLIEDVLTTARLDAGRLPIHAAPLELQGLLGQLAERAAHDPLVKHVEVSAGAPVMVAADGALIKRAVWNLVENAAKYGAPPIALAAEARNGHAVLSVTDQGAGIAAPDRERVFEPFWRADRAHTPGSGVGLGLTLARRIAEAHGGSVAIADAERGCRVEIKLPLDS